jgi:hypothetical protein
MNYSPASSIYIFKAHGKFRIQKSQKIEESDIGAALISVRFDPPFGYLHSI